MEELDSANQLIYNGLEFHWLQVVKYQGSPDIKIDGALYDVYGYQKWRREKDRPFSRLEFVPNGGQVAVIIGEWFEDADVQQQGAPLLGATNTLANELDSGPRAVAIGAGATQIIPPNASRVRGVSVQNIGTTTIALGKSAALNSALAGAAIILPPGAAANDGNGKTASFDGWQGGIWAVNITGAVAGSVLVSAY